jgi:phospholipid/cholesterol/gamma-HCH transport system substrate-binding protein
VIVASVTLAILVFLIRGTSGIFTSKIKLVVYFEHAEGIRSGQPVDLEGVPIGNVTGVRFVPGRTGFPVEVMMSVRDKFAPSILIGEQGSTATVKTAGVLGESYVDISSRKAKGAPATDGAQLRAGNVPDYTDVISASQSTLQNIDVLLERATDVVKQVQEGKGSLPQFINDPTTINKINAILNQVQGLLNDVSSGKGTIGQLFTDKTLAVKATDAIDKLDRLVDDINSGKGNLGKLVKDEELYHNLNQTVAKANKLMDDLNAGRGPAGKLLKDEELARKLQNTINKLSDIADRLDAGEGSAGKLLKDPSVYNNTDQLLVETRTLIKAIRENPKKYLTIHFRVF